MRSARNANIAGVFLVAGWVVAGWLVRSHAAWLSWLPKWALAFAVISPVAWIILYTAMGLLGYGKWWRSDLGTNMVWMETAVVWTSGVILWSQWFNHGELNTFDQAWLYLGGVIASGLVINWRSVIWLRYYRRDPQAEVKLLREENAELKAKLRLIQGGDGSGIPSEPATGEAAG